MKFCIEQVDGEWPIWAQKVIVDHVSEGDDEPYLAGMLAVAVLDALAVGPQPEPPINQMGMW